PTRPPFPTRRSSDLAQARGHAARRATDDAPHPARPRRDLSAGGLREEAPMVEPSPFRTELEAAVNARHSRLNPFTEKWVKGELTDRKSTRLNSSHLG